MLDVSLADTPCGETTGTDRNDANDTGTVGQLQESKVQHVDCGLKGDLERSQSILATGVRSPTASRKEKSCCRVLGCSTRATVRGLCYAHGGYYICKTEGCTKRAISRHLCRFHGGGTKCKSDGCEKLGLPTGKGFCYKHARENGIQVKPNCKIEGCTNLRQKFGRCKRHRDVPIESGTDKNDK
ncbi:hypothetical protein F441_12188 [Phytophthora nicotianae CJ01A1]|nr:hypothetical protein L915_11932 [Phytophthora nicotianae]ETL36128.1 hypothetical protein L916_11861 [Phytophthora nicotianae]ETO71382.1 hypothetical protein F444_12310 [Phytophthora nicotianae P1976]ETP12387.1 hypothetical protein F441_12188 [Phytophthora nicotianae CJ01A1]